MTPKDLDQLTAEIDAAVHPNGPLGKTTAPGLNALLKSLATELTARPEAGALDVAITLDSARSGAVPTVGAVLAGLQEQQYQQPFLFEITDSVSELRSCVTLSLLQARALVTGEAASAQLTYTDPFSGEAVALTATYDAATAAFSLRGTTGGNDLTVRQVGGGGGASAPASFATLQGQPADNAALAAALAAQMGGAAAPVLEFVFEAGFADTIGRTLGPRQAGTYASEQLQNVASATYQLNGAGVAPPFTLASTDVLQVAITRLNPAQPAVLTLLS